MYDRTSAACILSSGFVQHFHLANVSRGMYDSSARGTAIALVADCISCGQNIKHNWLAKSGWMGGRPDLMCETRETRQKLLVAGLGTLRRVNAPSISRQERLLGRSDPQWTRWWRNVGLQNERSMHTISHVRDTAASNCSDPASRASARTPKTQPYVPSNR